MRILVRCPNPIGDAVMATPAFRAIREGFPEAHVTFLARKPVDEVLWGGAWFDELWGVQKEKSVWEVAGKIRSGAFDVAILFPNSFRSALEVFLGRAKRRVGYAEHSRGMLLTDRLKRKEIDTVRSYLDLVKPLGLDPGEPRLELFVTEEQSKEADEFLRRHGVDEGGKIIMVVPGAAYGPAKLWRNDRWARVADALSEETGARVVISGSPAESHITREIAANMKADVIDAAAEGVRLGTVKALVKRSMLMLATDTGPRHFAAAFGVPSVVIFGPTEVERTESFLEDVVVVRKDVECGPCQKKICPLDRRCMELITAEEVIEAAKKALKGGAP